MNSQRIENLFRNLQKDPRSVFYSIRTLSKSIINKAHRSFYEKDVVFVNLYKKLEDKNFYQKKEIYLLLLSFLIKKAMLTTQLYIVLVRLLIWYMGDIADTRFLAKSAVDPKYCLLLVDLFTSKIYVYPIKNRSLLAKKLRLFYEDIKNKRTGKLRLQTDLEFKQNQIKN